MGEMNIPKFKVGSGTKKKRQDLLLLKHLILGFEICYPQLPGFYNFNRKVDL
jgi:hypothetical protein